jgi:carboxymethylenebutenolidase
MAYASHDLIVSGRAYAYQEKPLGPLLLSEKKEEAMNQQPDSQPAPVVLTPEQQRLADLWDEHTRHEFLTKTYEGALATMVEDASVNHVPILTGGSGKTELKAFYSTYFIPQMPPDIELIPISRTVGTDRIVDELVVRMTHSVEMDWFLPGIPATGKRIEFPMVAVVQFRSDQMAAERIYWDQASVLVQLGLLDASTLPIAGVEVARKVLDSSLPSNELIKRAYKR